MSDVIGWQSDGQLLDPAPGCRSGIGLDNGLAAPPASAPTSGRKRTHWDTAVSLLARAAFKMTHAGVIAGLKSPGFNN